MSATLIIARNKMPKIDGIDITKLLIRFEFQ